MLYTTHIREFQHLMFSTWYSREKKSITRLETERECCGRPRMERERSIVGVWALCCGMSIPAPSRRPAWTKPRTTATSRRLTTTSEAKREEGHCKKKSTAWPSIRVFPLQHPQLSHDFDSFFAFSRKTRDIFLRYFLIYYRTIVGQFFPVLTRGGHL